MKTLSLLLASFFLTFGSVSAQNIHSSNAGYESKTIINKKKFRVLYVEVAVDKSVDEVWKEVAGNFMNISDIVKDITVSRSLSGDSINGLGARRYCKLEFQGKTVELKERIIDYKANGDHREFTYEVYESKGFPAKSYNSWVVRKGKDGKTYLGTVFRFRANFAPVTGLMAKQLEKSGLEGGIWSYKHYLETGEKKVDPKRLERLYSGK